MLVELDDDMLSKVVADSLLESYQLVLDNNGPMFSHDRDEEKKKKVKQLLKGLERSHDFYSVTPLKQRLKSEKALQELHNIDQELGLYDKG